MASITTKTLKNGKLAYLVRWTDPDGEEQSRQYSHRNSTKPATDAKEWKIEVEGNLQSGLYRDPAAGNVTFETYAEHWRSVQSHKHQSANQIERILRLHVYPVIGHRRLNSLLHTDIQAVLRRAQDRGYSDSLVRSAARLTASVLNAAVIDRKIPESPARQVKVPPRRKGNVVIPTLAQVRVMAGITTPDGNPRPAPDPAAQRVHRRDHSAVLDRYRILVMLAATTGQRQGECCGLDLSEIDFLGKDRHVRVRRQLISEPGMPLHLADPKSEAGVRDIPLSRAAADELARHLERYPPRPQQIPTLQDLRADRPPEKWKTWHLVCSSSRGGLVRRNTVTHHIEPVLRAYGFPKQTGLHLFRHFYASALIAGNVDAKLVMTLMGHASIQETYDTYGHLFPNSSARARDAVDAAFADDGALDERAEGPTDDVAELAAGAVVDLPRYI